MRVLIWAEFKKVLANRFLLVLIAGLFLIQSAVILQELNRAGEDYYSEADLASIYTEIRGMSEEEQIQKLEAESKEIGNQLLSNFDESNYMNQYGQIMARNDVIEHIRECMEYPEFLDSVAEQAESLGRSSLLAQKDTFSSRNTQKLAKIYEKLSPAELLADSSAGIRILTQNSLTDLFLLICFSVLVLVLTVSEKMEGYDSFLRTKPKGGINLYAAKAAVLVLISLCLILLFYGGAALVIAWRVGFCRMNIPVQSLDLYYQCPYQLRVGEFLICHFAVKIFTLLVILLLFFTIGILASGYVMAYGMGGVLFLISALLQFQVNPHSAFGIAREISLTTLLDSGHYFTTAVNVNLFGYPVPTTVIGAAAGIFYLSLDLVMSIVLWLRPVEVRSLSIPFLQNQKQIHFPNKYKGISYFEWKKLFLVEHGLILSLFFIAIVLWMHVPSRYVSLTDYYYGVYSQKLEGELSSEKEQYLMQEAERLETAGERIEEYYARYESGEIGEIELNYYISREEIPTEQEYAFARAQSQYQKLSDLESSSDGQGCQTVYVNESGWERVFGKENNKNQVRDYLIQILFLILCLNHFSSMEDSSGVRMLAKCTSRGSTYSAYAKIKWCMVLGGGSAVFIYLCQLISTHLAWPLNSWSSLHISVQSITAISCNIAGLPVLYFLILTGLLRMTAGMAAALMVLAISRWMRRPLLTIITAYIILGLPATLILMGII